RTSGLFPVLVQSSAWGVGDIAFSLESAKKLKELLGRDAGSAPLHTRSQLTFFTLCGNPELPEEFQGICKGKYAPQFSRGLVNLAVPNIALCDICANAACTSCY
uniref:Guanylate cyclase activator 2B n=1 Tax=Podarcis muralis TaxID=64176 RepID=A0A670IPR3_PODMU